VKWYAGLVFPAGMIRNEFTPTLRLDDGLSLN
jgi:hypothetical protein